MDTRSQRFKLSLYDLVSASENVLLFVVAIFVANIDAFQAYLGDLGVNAFWITAIVSAILMLGKKFVKDYS